MNVTFRLHIHITSYIHRRYLLLCIPIGTYDVYILRCTVLTRHLALGHEWPEDGLRGQEWRVLPR